MGKAQENIKDAVEAGYWHLYRYNPDLKKEGKNPFKLDSKEPTTSFRDFIMGQVRYSSLAKEFPDVADKLFEITEENAKSRYHTYKELDARETAIKRRSEHCGQNVFFIYAFKIRFLCQAQSVHGDICLPQSDTSVVRTDGNIVIR